VLVNKNLYKKQILMFPFILVFLEIVTFLSTDMYLPALPRIATDFNITEEQAQYTQALWFMGSMSMQLFLGPLSERYGRKAVLSTGIIIFILTSAICALTNDITIFSWARFFQGTTVCAVIVAGYATIHEIYSGKQAVQILAIMGSVTILAPALGPFCGAVIIEFSSWQNIFSLLAGAATLGLLGLYIFMPKQSVDSIGKLDAVKLVDIWVNYKNIVSNKIFMCLALLNGMLIINFFMWLVESPFIIIKQYNKSEVYFGLAQLFVFSGYICGAQLAKKLVDKITAKQICTLGLSIVGSSLILLIIFSYFDFSITLNIVAMVGVALGSASLSGLLNRMAIESAREPMAQRVAIYSLIISLAACVGSYFVTLIDDMSFYNISLLMFGCYFIALAVYSNVKNYIKLN
jgi:Bcr/CflA subfamily drug resistance transporter